ncbi:unnamed protein product, partial [Nesidiocoris tenuis]
MTTPATGERILNFDRHAAWHSRVNGPRPNYQRRAGLRAALITFGDVFQLGPHVNDAPEDGRTAEGTRAITNFESTSCLNSHPQSSSKIHSMLSHTKLTKKNLRQHIYE